MAEFDSCIAAAHSALAGGDAERAGSLAFRAVSEDPSGAQKLQTLAWDVLDLEDTMSEKLILYAPLLTLTSPDRCITWIVSASSALQRGDWQKFLSDFERAEKLVPQERNGYWDRFKNGTFHLFFLYEKYWRMRDDLDAEYSIDFQQKWQEFGRVADYFDTLIQRVLEASEHVPIELDEWTYLKSKRQVYPQAYRKWELQISKKLL